MIENANASKNSSSEFSSDYKKYIGVASVSMLAVNPNNDTLRLYGWQIPEDADEPKYVMVDGNGKKSARVRLLVQIQDLKDKPVVPLDFWIRPDIQFNKDATKCQIIDSFGRTAYGTKAEIQAHEIPRYSNGLASISSDYKPAHVGQEALVRFLMKFLNVTPLQMFSRKSNEWVATKNPGRLTIDYWDRLCNGNVAEIKEYLNTQKDNRVKVIFGIKETDDNKTYQNFLTSTFIANGARVDITTGEYASARKAIDKDREWADENGKTYPFIFSAAPVKEWEQSATDVDDNSEKEDLPAFDSSEYTTEMVDDLPFA